MLQPYSEAESSRRAARSQASDECLITGRQLRQLLGNCSEMHIWRLLNRENLRPLAFPKPIKINGRNYWRLGTIGRWIEDQEAKSRGQSALAVRAARRSTTSAANPRRRATTSAARGGARLASEGGHDGGATARAASKSKACPRRP
jgi:predicted DNA-binding transcriptional regulator AlpA